MFIILLIAVVALSRAKAEETFLIQEGCPIRNPNYMGERECFFFGDEVGSPRPTPDFTMSPTYAPTFVVFLRGTNMPSDAPSLKPSNAPSSKPSSTPSDVPSKEPSNNPSDKPSNIPSSTPSDFPSDEPSNKPSDVPSGKPSDLPSDIPSNMPSFYPTFIGKGSVKCPTN
jgi:PT repeat